MNYLYVLSLLLVTPLCAELSFLSEVNDQEISRQQENYQLGIETGQKKRVKMATRYRNNQDRSKVIIEAREAIQRHFFDSIFIAWYKTPWDFNGVSQSPGKGKIACGYFVTTTLRDAGFKLSRVRWAQQPSTKIIKRFCEKSTVKVFYKKPLSDIESYLKSNGEGLYIVGLDTHVGYIAYRKGKMAFVHADYYNRQRGVISEPLSGKNPLADSKYRMIGKLLGDEMITRWLKSTPYPNP